jgi:hypothetical protein
LLSRPHIRSFFQDYIQISSTGAGQSPVQAGLGNYPPDEGEIPLEPGPGEAGGARPGPPPGGGFRGGA